MAREFHMMPKKSYRGKILLLGLAILIFVCALRYIPKKEPIIEERQEAEAVTKQITEIYLGKNSAIKLKSVYNCGHIKTETRETEDALAGKTKEEILKIHPDWKIYEFTSELLSAEQTIDETCDSHYVIKLKNNTLYVYKKNNLSESVKKQEISTSMLTKEDIKELENGINADTEFEVLQILESFVSWNLIKTLDKTKYL